MKIKGTPRSARHCGELPWKADPEDGRRLRRYVRGISISQRQFDSLTAVEDESMAVEITWPKMSVHSGEPTELTVCRFCDEIIRGSSVIPVLKMKPPFHL